MNKARRVIVAVTTPTKTAALAAMIMIQINLNDELMKIAGISSVVLDPAVAIEEVEVIFHHEEEGVDGELIEITMLVRIPKTKTIKEKKMKIPHPQIGCL